MFTHEVWFDGAANPVLLDLDDEQLFQQFQQWVRGDVEASGHGWTGTVEGKTWAINFHRVACIAIVTKKDKGRMGFAG
jgi:hypothetical protein